MFKKNLKTFDMYADADFYLSRIYYRSQDYNKALEHIERAKKNYKIFAALTATSLKQYRARLRTYQQNLELELREIETELANHPTEVTHNSQSAKLKQDLELAIAEKKRSLDSVKNRLSTPMDQSTKIPADFFYIHGNIFFKIKEFNRSYKEYLKTIEINPKHGNTYINLANLNYMGRRYKQALVYLEKAENYGAEINHNFKKTVLEALNKQAE